MSEVPYYKDYVNNAIRGLIAGACCCAVFIFLGLVHIFRWKEGAVAKKVIVETDMVMDTEKIVDTNKVTDTNNDMDTNMVMDTNKVMDTSNDMDTNMVMNTNNDMDTDMLMDTNVAMDKVEIKNDDINAIEADETLEMAGRDNKALDICE